MTSHTLLDRPVGIYEKALPPAAWPEMLESARSAGFDFVEMSIDESDERLARLTWTEAERTALRRAIRSTGVPIYSICLSAHRRFGFGSADPEVRVIAARIMEQAILLAVDLGIRVVQIAGYFAYYELPDPTARTRYVEGLRHGVEFAAEHGVMLGIENIDTADMASADDALALVQEVGSPWLRLYPDAGNFAVHRLDVVDSVLRVVPQAVGLHLKDARAGEPRRVAYGSGLVPFGDVFAALTHSNYDGPFTLEMWNDDPATALAGAHAALLWIKDRLRQADEAAASEESASQSHSTRPAGGVRDSGLRGRDRA